MMIVPMSELTMSLIRLMRRKGSESALDHAWDAWNEATDGDEEGYCELAKQITGRLVVVRDNVAYFATKCGECGDVEPECEMEEAFGEQWCESCRDNYLYTCSDCGCYVHYDDYNCAHDEIYCDTCFQDFSWCEHCEEYYRDGDEHPCNNNSCDCTAPNLHFAFPANGRGTISEDERINVTLPSGTITDEGISAIAYMVAGATENSHHAIRKVIDDIGPGWQTKRGNFTRRLSSGVWKALAVKLDNATISKVGNLARQHSTSDASWHVEVTRDLNLPAEDFYHEDSCWWQSYADSRCALKNWGGIGLRSFHGEDFRNGVSGRAWVQPLDEDLKPTHQTIGVHAYIVYNGYGALDGYTPARIVAHMAGMTYKKVDLSASPQYVNSGYGYLVADEQTCSQTTAVFYSHGKHSHLDASEHHA